MIAQRIGNKNNPTVFFGHGWGQDHKAWNSVVEVLRGSAECVLLDFPGVAKGSTRPEGAWESGDYAREVARIIQAENKPVTWVGHSYGGRVGLQLGAKHPENIEGLVLVSAHGIKSVRTPMQQWKTKLRDPLRKWEKSKAGDDEAKIIAWEKKWGSPDYVQSRVDGVRDIFLKAVNEDQSAHLPQIRLPVKLLFGSKDVDTPPALGRRMAELIPNAEFTLAESMDHHTILWRGRHLIAMLAKEIFAQGEGA